jgi:hypothetical protein
MLRTSPHLWRCVRPPRAATARHFSSESRNWFGIDPEYLSMRGLGIFGRVMQGMPEFTRFMRAEPRIFPSGASDEARSSMFVLSQFPMNAQVHLPAFVKDAERAAHTVLQRLYAEDSSETRAFLEQLATSKSLKMLLHKPSAPVEGASKAGSTVLEQLSVNSATLEGVDYTRELEEEEVKREWLALKVHYDVTEHLLTSPKDGDVGIEDRRAINTQFKWTFEAEVTKPEEMQWTIVDATPFDEKPAVFTANAAQTDEKDEDDE